MRDFAAVAPLLNALIHDPSARLTYDIFAGALVWSDELNPAEEFDLKFENIGAIRSVWHYRSMLILGTPKENCKPDWEEALRLCPAWPVFLPERRDPALVSMFLTMREKSRKKWDEDVARIEQQLSERKKKAIA